MGRGGDGFGRAQLDFLRRRKAPRALSERCSTLAARRNAAAARLALGLVLELITLPPVMRLLGLSPSQDAKCLALGHLVMSVPISLITFRAVYASTPSIRVRSTSVIRFKCVQTSKRGAFPLIRLRPDFAAGGPPVLRSSNRSKWVSISRSHSAILA